MTVFTECPDARPVETPGGDHYEITSLRSGEEVTMSQVEKPWVWGIYWSSLINKPTCLDLSNYNENAR